MRQRKLLLPVILGSDDLIAHIKTNAKTGRNLVVIKESYGNGLIPFFTESFDNIYVLDLRYCEVNAIKFCKQVDATDLLFANCAYTVAGGNCDYFSYIRNILKVFLYSLFQRL